MIEIEKYFGEINKSKISKMISYEKMLEDNINAIYDSQFPLFNGNYSLDIYSFLKDKQLNDECMSPKDVILYMSKYFENLPDWSNPGTMINVIPCVNLVGQAVSNVAQAFNPNLAQDTYSGNILLAELETVKYMSDLIHWDWLKSAGVFTFGGTGTNLYSLKLSILNANSKSSKSGIEQGRYFTVTSKNGHPCHYQLCDWVGLGTDACIELPCNMNGTIDINKTYEIIDNEIKKGKIFLGFNLTGGSTNEMYIDPIKDIYDMRERIVVENKLDYSPWIHVDSVLGWVYLFYNDYDFDKNEININVEVLKVIKSIVSKVKQFYYADSVGIDFHKTGFCSYVSSLFLVKDKNKYFKLNPSKSYDIKNMKYGEYNPFYVSLEYSRACHGPLSALSSLKSLGKKSYQKLLADLVEFTRYFRLQLQKIPNVLVIEPDSEGFATIFTLLPRDCDVKNIRDLMNASEKVLNECKKLNISFGKKVLFDCVKRRKHFIFTASRSYVLPSSNIKIGALKAYPMSVFLNKAAIDKLIGEIKLSINELYEQVDEKLMYNGYELFQDMSKEDK